MEFTIKIPTISQFGSFAAWDGTLGLFFVLAIAFCVGAWMFMSMFGGIWGGRGPSRAWQWTNLVIGTIISLIAFVLSGSWFVGGIIAVVCFFLLAEIRERAGG